MINIFLFFFVYIFCNGQSSNIAKEFYSNGSVKAVLNYHTGDYEGYYANGVTQSRGTIQNGKRVGSWEYYDESGNLMASGNYNLTGLKKGVWKYSGSDVYSATIDWAFFEIREENYSVVFNYPSNWVLAPPRDSEALFIASKCDSSAVFCWNMNLIKSIKTATDEEQLDIVFQQSNEEMQREFGASALVEKQNMKINNKPIRFAVFDVVLNGIKVKVYQYNYMLTNGIYTLTLASQDSVAFKIDGLFNEIAFSVQELD